MQGIVTILHSFSFSVTHYYNANISFVHYFIKPISFRHCFRFNMQCPKEKQRRMQLQTCNLLEICCARVRLLNCGVQYRPQNMVK